MSNKRKAAEFFKDIEVEDQSQPTRNDTSPRLSKAALLKEARQKQLLDAVVNDTSRTDRASEYQSRSYAHWTRPDSVNAAHSYRFEEKYSSFVTGDKNGSRSVSKTASNNSNSSYFDKQERRHNDAIFSSERRNEMHSSDSDGDDSSDDDKKRNNINRRSNVVEERIPITSFSKEDSTPPPPASFAPQTKFGQKFFNKALSADLNKDNNNNDDDDSLPLYKRVKKGDRVLARYSVNDQLYPARVKTVMHSGYSSAQYDVLFDFYDKVHTVGWADISEIINNSTAVPSSSSGSGALQPPTAPSATVVVEVSELSHPQTTMYHTVAGVPIRTIRYDSSTGKAVINEEPSAPVVVPPPTTPSSSLLSSNPLLASKINDIVNRINSGVLSASSGGGAGGGVGSSITTAAPPQPVVAAPVITSSQRDIPSTRFDRTHTGPNSTASTASTGTGSYLADAGVFGYSSAAIGTTATPLVNPKLAQRAKGNWKLAKPDKPN